MEKNNLSPAPTKTENDPQVDDDSEGVKDSEAAEVRLSKALSMPGFVASTVIGDEAVIDANKENKAEVNEERQVYDIKIEEYTEVDPEDGKDPDSKIEAQADTGVDAEAGSDSDMVVLDKLMKLCTKDFKDDEFGGGGCGPGCGACRGRDVCQSCGFLTFLKIFIKDNCKLSRCEAKKRAKAIYTRMRECEKEKYRRKGCCKRKFRCKPRKDCKPCGDCCEMEFDEEGSDSDDLMDSSDDSDKN